MSDTLVINCSPDPGKDPEVILSDRNPSASGASKIRWRKDPAWVAANPTLDFKFIGFVPVKDYTETFDNPFKKIKVGKKRIRSKFLNAVTGPDYKYTVAIEFNGKALNSDIVTPGGPSDGRAVIRN